MAKNRTRAALSAVGILVVAVAALFGSAAPVLAHARYASSTPGKGAIVPVSPASVEVTFTNDIQKIAGTYDLQVNKDRGSSITTGPAVVDDADRTKLSVPVQADLQPGRYVVNWKNVSDEDGDPAEGAFSFYVGDYTPTTIDLSNDAQLELIGAEEEETPANGDGDTPVSSNDTPAAGPTSGGPTRPATSPTAATGAETGDEDDGNNAVVWIVVAGVAAAAVAAVGGFLIMRRRA